MSRSLGLLAGLLSLPLIDCSPEPEPATSPRSAGSGVAAAPVASAGTPSSSTLPAGSGGANAQASAGSPDAGRPAQPGAGGTAGVGGGSSGIGGTGGAAGGTAGGAGTSAPVALEPFSFFVTSLEGMRRLSGDQDGFGGDLRHGEADGLAGADKICTELAESSMPGSSAKQWRALLSVNRGPIGEPVHAIDRIGEGPWFDRLGRVVAMTKSALLNERPMGADPEIAEDLPNEFGVPNHTPDPAGGPQDNHHILTGSDERGRAAGAIATCEDWTSTEAEGRPRFGYSWTAAGRVHWLSGGDEGGCGAGIVLVAGFPSDPSNPVVGSGGGYGGIYCFALTP
jgi:hypothetical protein